MIELFDKPIPLQDGIKIADITYNAIWIKRQFNANDVIESAQESERLYAVPGSDRDVATGKSKQPEYVVKQSPAILGRALVIRMVKFVGPEDSKIPFVPTMVDRFSGTDFEQLVAIAYRLGPAVLAEVAKLGEKQPDTSGKS